MGCSTIGKIIIIVIIILLPDIPMALEIPSPKMNDNLGARAQRGSPTLASHSASTRVTVSTSKSSCELASQTAVWSLRSGSVLS